MYIIKLYAKMLYFIIVSSIIVSICSGCQDSSVNKEDLDGFDVELYKNTPAWELAKAVKKQDTVLIKKICKKDTSLLNFQEPKFGQTLLEWAVFTDRFQSAKALAEMGADPNIQSYDGTSAFIHAADKLKTSKYLKLLLKHGGEVNAVADTSKKQPKRTPLIAASKRRLESVRLLVEAGADINYDYKGYCALRVASVQEKIRIVKYLINKGADFTKPLMVPYDNPQYDTLYLNHMLRYMDFPIGSKEHKLKMEVVDTLKAHGLNYWETKIPNSIKERRDTQYLRKY